MFDNRVGNALGYAVILFLLPFFVAGVMCVAGEVVMEPLTFFSGNRNAPSSSPQDIKNP